MSDPARSSRRRRLIATGSFVLLAIAALAIPTAAQAATYRDCSGKVLAPGADFHRCDLGGIVIIGQKLDGISFARANLAGANGGCDPDLSPTSLVGAIISRADLHGAKLCDANLTDADLHASNLRDVSFEDATLRNANLSSADLVGVSAGFASFADTDLSNATWRDGDAVGGFFAGADLHRADLRGTDLRSARMAGADLRYARLGGVDFTSTDLTGASWKHATGLSTAIWSDTTCPDGTNSDANGGTCVGH